jgi:hypothetical protein
MAELHDILKSSPFMAALESESLFFSFEYDPKDVSIPKALRLWKLKFKSRATRTLFDGSFNPFLTVDRAAVYLYGKALPDGIDEALARHKWKPGGSGPKQERQ